MNKLELRDSFIAKGWTVEPVVDWRLVSQVEDVEKYDVNVVSPDDTFQTAQVKVIGDVATPLGAFKEVPSTFSERLRTFLDTIEVSAGVFAVVVSDTKESDEVATCVAYMEDGSVANYAVKERADTFSFKELV